MEGRIGFVRISEEGLESQHAIQARLVSRFETGLLHGRKPVEDGVDFILIGFFRIVVHDFFFSLGSCFELNSKLLNFTDIIDHDERKNIGIVLRVHH